LELETGWDGRASFALPFIESGSSRIEDTDISPMEFDILSRWHTKLIRGCNKVGYAEENGVGTRKETAIFASKRDSFSDLREKLYTNCSIEEFSLQSWDTTPLEKGTKLMSEYEIGVCGLQRGSTR
jgi:hypothetical protein